MIKDYEVKVVASSEVYSNVRAEHTVSVKFIKCRLKDTEQNPLVKHLVIGHQPNVEVVDSNL